MSKANNIYQVDGRTVLAPNTVIDVDSFEIPNNNRSFKIKNVWFDYVLSDNVTNENIPNAQMRLQQIVCVIGANSETPPASAFLNFIPSSGSSVWETGKSFVLYRPQTMQFDSFVFNNKCEIWVGGSNSDLINAVFLNYSLTIEIEYL